MTQKVEGKLDEEHHDEGVLISVQWSLRFGTTGGGNGRTREGERESFEKCCFCLQNDLKEP